MDMSQTSTKEWNVKLRIEGNSLRLRVSRSELARFLAGARTEETIHLNRSIEARLTYGLESTSSVRRVDPLATRAC